MQRLSSKLFIWAQCSRLELSIKRLDPNFVAHVDEPVGDLIHGDSSFFRQFIFLLFCWIRFQRVGGKPML